MPATRFTRDQLELVVGSLIDAMACDVRGQCPPGGSGGMDKWTDESIISAITASLTTHLEALVLRVTGEEMERYRLLHFTHQIEEEVAKFADHQFRTFPPPKDTPLGGFELFPAPIVSDLFDTYLKGN